MPFHRPAKKTLATRVRKKLFDKESWYKKTAENDDEKSNKKGEKVKRNEKNTKKEKHAMEQVQEERNEKGQTKSLVKSVIFVPNTENSELANRLREG